MQDEIQEQINEQRDLIERGDFYVQLNRACVIGDGILRLNELEANKLIGLYEKEIPGLNFFIPASGSGSRMFKCLYEWLDSGVDTNESNLFFELAEKLAVSKELAFQSKKELAEYLIEKYADSPKGMVPFHMLDDRVITPFEAHLMQVKHLAGGNGAKVHFTVQEEFLPFIQEITEKVDNGISVEFSFQDEKTNSFCFDEYGKVVQEGDGYLRRPAGHGALINNLNDFDGDIVLMKNIDNIQHNSKAEKTEVEWKKSIGLLIEFKSSLNELHKNYSKEALVAFNQKYQLVSEVAEDSGIEIVEKWMSRPTRVCGMVKNEGAPGGGPFWVGNGKGMSKQIVEKAQISPDEAQQSLVQNSSHFNPVFITLSKRDCNGEMLDLRSFVDESAYFIVEKDHKGKSIKYRELPGLWNGAMSDWNTLFLEIPSEVFSPVKSIVDLGSELHQQSM